MVKSGSNTTNGNGANTAAMHPTLGMKLEINVSSPNTSAQSIPGQPEAHAGDALATGAMNQSTEALDFKYCSGAVSEF